MIHDIFVTTNLMNLSIKQKDQRDKEPQPTQLREQLCLSGSSLQHLSQLANDHGCSKRQGSQSQLKGSSSKCLNQCLS